MELWIRTQSKQSLVKVDNVSITEQTKTRYNVDSGEWILGRYNSFERALEVLNEIQENIVKQGQVIILTDERGIPNGSKFFSYVYEMPKE